MDYNNQQYGSSVSFCDYILKYQIEGIKPKIVVDFGAGGGKNGRIIRQVLGDDCVIIAVEACERTTKMLIENGPYNRVENILLQDWIKRDSNKYDLAIFGDVLEHLTHRQIIKVLRKCYNEFVNIIIVAPLHDIFQEDIYGNPLEIHQVYITSSFFNRFNPIEKHIIIGKDWTIMNVRIVSNSIKEPFYRRVALYIFHYCMIISQPLGLARPIVNILKRYLIRFKWLLRS